MCSTVSTAVSTSSTSSTAKRPRSPLWLETDLESDDFHGIIILFTRGYGFLYVVIGEWALPGIEPRIFPPDFNSAIFNMMPTVIIRGVFSGKSGPAALKPVSSPSVSTSSDLALISSSPSLSCWTSASSSSSSSSISSVSASSLSSSSFSNSSSSSSSSSSSNSSASFTSTSSTSSASSSISSSSASLASTVSLTSPSYSVLPWAETKELDHITSYRPCLMKFIRDQLRESQQPRMVCMKPPRELLLELQIPRDDDLLVLLKQTTCYMYGSFNLRALGCSSEWLHRLLDSFKCVYLYESHYGTGPKNSINKDTTPEFFEKFQSMAKENVTVQRLKCWMEIWNSHILQEAQKKLPHPRAQKVISNLKGNEAFQFLAADNILALCLDNDSFVTKQQVYFQDGYTCVREEPNKKKRKTRWSHQPKIKIEDSNLSDVMLYGSVPWSWIDSELSRWLIHR